MQGVAVPPVSDVPPSIASRVVALASIRRVFVIRAHHNPPQDGQQPS